ncbi:TetR/AcrR family transcriptional regulator [Agromyces sp. MMS24-K17]|uniref:TetR/AcrR family transcriptional regulator n=1 Tax=Agromyces sp. MMS24-K17 TaxID=3372850 RepID=UPI0037544BDA
MARPRQFDEAAVLAAALDVFWSNGYERTSIADLAAATGIANGSLYAAFGSKHALFLRVLDWYCAGRVEIVRDAMATSGSADAAIGALFDAIVDDCAAQPDRRGCLMLNTLAEFGSRDAEVLAVCRRANDGMERAIADRLAGAVPGASVDVDELAAQVLVVTQGLIQASRLETPAGELRAVARGYRELLPIA